ncbi:uncharacterized protein PV09_02451, partial [Verruconis gallopava]
MNKAVEQDLLSLLPSITLPLPRELLELAVSLLSQSRSKAGSLKQDEEIARGYVCANIACDRLKTKLNLPTIVVRPPVAPKVYKKVYAYLDSALTAGTPRKHQKNSIRGQNEPSTPSKSRRQLADDTPTRTPARTSKAKAAVHMLSSTKRKHANSDGDNAIASWTMPAIRLLCKAFEIPNAAPHIYVGVCSIVRVIQEQQGEGLGTPTKKRARKSANNDIQSEVIAAFDEKYIPALIIVVTFFTRARMVGAPEPDEYAKQRQTAMETIGKAIPDGLKTDEGNMISMIENLLREAEKRWLDMEWYYNLPEANMGGDESSPDMTSETGAHFEVDKRSMQVFEVPKRGFGSMMTDATDWLSEDRNAEYKIWKTEIMQKISDMENTAN